MQYFLRTIAKDIACHHKWVYARPKAHLHLMQVGRCSIIFREIDVIFLSGIKRFYGIVRFANIYRNRLDHILAKENCKVHAIIYNLWKLYCSCAGKAKDKAKWSVHDHCAEAPCKYGTSKLYVYHKSFKHCYAYHIIIVVFSYEKSLKKGVLIKISAWSRSY